MKYFQNGGTSGNTGNRRFNSCFPFGQKNRSELLLSLKPHVPFARNGGHHAHWFYRPLSPQGPPCAQRSVAQTCPNQSISAFSNQSIHYPNVHFQTRVSIIQTCILTFLSILTIFESYVGSGSKYSNSALVFYCCKY
jgi:hypothetical protein